MKNNIHLFSRTAQSIKPDVLEKVGLRGQEYIEFADLDLPIMPGFIIDSEVAAYLDDKDLKPFLQENLEKMK